MTLLWIEGFESFGTTNGVAPVGLEQKYPVTSSISNMDVENGRIVGKSLETANAASLIVTPSLGGGSATFVTGFGLKYSIILTTTRFFSAFESGASSLELNFRLTAGGLITAYRGNTLLGTSLSGMSADTWAYIEIKAFIHNTTGTVQVKINGTEVMNLTNQDTKNIDDAWYQYQLRGAGFINLYTFDDWYILDTNGSVNNDFLGNVRVDAIFPDGVGANSDWTPSAGSNYQNVDENPHDTDTTYNEDGTSTNKDTHTYGAMPTIDTVLGLQINTLARLTDATPFNLETVIISNVTTSNDTGQAVPGSYGLIQRISELDPDTAAAWTESGINAAEFGYEIE